MVPSAEKKLVYDLPFSLNVRLCEVVIEYQGKTWVHFNNHFTSRRPVIKETWSLGSVKDQEKFPEELETFQDHILYNKLNDSLSFWSKIHRNFPGDFHRQCNQGQ